ncbi:MAG: glutathione S-transferase family protein [Pseudomonadota bacterium]
MKLITAGPSPYGRKAKMAIQMKGLQDHVEVVAADTLPVENPELQKSNPLAKIPVLVTDAGQSIFDSKVICEYLDAQVVSPVLFPGDGPLKWEVLTLGALADGILDAGLLLVYEKRFRPEEHWVADWQKRQQLKIDGALAHLEQQVPAEGVTPHYGDLTLACALGYLDFRFDGAWRSDHPKLVAWLDRFANRVPAFEATRPA